jgi:hypothetical protein
MARVYELYRNGGAVTCRSVLYDRDSKEVWHVAAHSAKQACYLAGHGIWAKPTSEVGIVEYDNGRNDGNEWLDANGERRGSPLFRDGQKYKLAVSEKPRRPTAADPSREAEDGRDLPRALERGCSEPGD